MKTSRGNLVAAASLLLLGLIAGGCDGGGGLKYVDGWGAAVKEARADGKPILLNFGGPW